MTNLRVYAENYRSYESSLEILAAIEEQAPDLLPEDFSTDEEQRASRAYRIWADPTDAEKAAVEARAWELAQPDEDTLHWGCTALPRPEAPIDLGLVVVVAVLGLLIPLAETEALRLTKAADEAEQANQPDAAALRALADEAHDAVDRGNTLVMRLTETGGRA